MKKLIYTFWIPRGVIAQTLFRLKETIPSDIEVIYGNGDRGLKALINKIDKDQPEYVIGLGYSSRNHKSIKEESIFINEYLKKPIIKNGESEITASLKLGMQGTAPSTKTTHGPCNSYAYSVENLIRNKNYYTLATFLHVPPQTSLPDLLRLFDQIIKYPES